MPAIVKQEPMQQLEKIKFSEEALKKANASNTG